MMTRTRINALFGSLIAVVGVVGLFLLVEAQAGHFKGPFSSPLRSHPQLWGLIFCSMSAFGIWLLWNLTHRQTNWRPTYSGRRFQSVVLYTRDNCPLCDEAAEILAAYRRWLPPVTEVDIALDPTLEQRLGEEIPVVQMDGATRFKGHVSEILLQRLIEGTRPLR